MFLRDDPQRSIHRGLTSINIDLHVHTNRFSMCSTTRPDALVERAIDAGLDGLVFTEHNTFWPEDALDELRARYPDIQLFNGAEIDVPSLHHVLTILPTPDPTVIDPADPASFIRAVHEREGVAIAAHPFRFYHDYDERNRDYALDGVEIASRNMCDQESIQRARRLADSWRAFTVANSDAHSLDPVGEFYSTLPESVSTEMELIESMKNHSPKPDVPAYD